jgi:hypothetical protein
LWGRASVAVVGWSLHDVDDREARVGVEEAAAKSAVPRSPVKSE